MAENSYTTQPTYSILWMGIKVQGDKMQQVSNLVKILQNCNNIDLTVSGIKLTLLTFTTAIIRAIVHMYFYSTLVGE